jgi:hypothetical protein
VAQVVVKCFTTSCRSSYDCGRETKAKVEVQVVFVAAADYDATTRKLQCLSLKRELAVDRMEKTCQERAFTKKEFQKKKHMAADGVDYRSKPLRGRWRW